VDDRIIELLYRNLQEVFGEGDAVRRRAAIKDFYTEDCVLYVPSGAFVGHDALDKFGDLRATHPHFEYTSWRSTSPAQRGDSGMGLRPERRGTRIHRIGCRHVRDGKIAALYVFLNPKFA
jgi:SnoaL-like domain